MQYQPIKLAVILAGVLGTAVPQLGWSSEASDCGEDKKCNDYLRVSGDVMRQPVHLVSDPKQNRLPLPAYDGSGFLRSIPGFNITRKGGSGGDPMFRGLGGSRLNIVDDGQHVYGASSGFGTLALNASWSYNKDLSLILGVENLFDTAYAEHVSKAGTGNDLPGSEAMFRVNEPGRNLWAKLTYQF
ncbi:hypothetical protein Shewana3_0621 [Shewanella sp. ANA-3]|nr:TonB-dependent receptor [Shewanella sp. ANA-3]ABK46860.1 hypothetical protein Shewana3_0621 [Shewanella sp. ANA-3]